MRFALFSFLPLSFIGAVLKKRRAGQAKFAEIASLPVGLKIIHTPNPVMAQAGGRSGYDYTWVYKTTVQVTEGPVTIEEFGSFAQLNGRWVLNSFSGKPFTPKDFAEWYHCPGATIYPHTRYWDPENWTGSKHLITFTSNWYYVGHDETGRRVKGEAEVKQIGEM